MGGSSNNNDSNTSSSSSSSSSSSLIFDAEMQLCMQAIQMNNYVLQYLQENQNNDPIGAGSVPGISMKGAKSKATADTKLGVRKKATEAKKAKKAAKDPNKPKRPPSAFFVFMEEFRKTYKETHPNNKSVAAVGKAGGEKWKQFTETEKAPYVAKAEKRKTEYQKNMDAYNRKQADEEESDKSRSEVHDDDEDEDGSEEEEDDD